VTSRDRKALLCAAVAASVLMLVAGVAGHEGLIAYAAPLLVLVLPLLAGRYLGEERLVRVVARARRSRRPRAAAARPTVRRPGALVPRGGSLIASALAKRPPPLPAAG
jgi:hypothetical protein